MSKHYNILENRSNLFTIVMFTIIGILAIPVLAPHIFHTFQIFHILVHIFGLGLAGFLSIVSAIAYARIRTKRMFFTLLAFSALVISQSLDIVDAAWQYTYYLGPFPAGEISHFFILCTLGMFTLSIFRKD